jgi:hypothetical protein
MTLQEKEKLPETPPKIRERWNALLENSTRDTESFVRD